MALPVTNSPPPSVDLVADAPCLSPCLAPYDLSCFSIGGVHTKLELYRDCSRPATAFGFPALSSDSVGKS